MDVLVVCAPVSEAALGEPLRKLLEGRGARVSSQRTGKASEEEKEHSQDESESAFRVVVLLIDDVYFVQSPSCMEELVRAVRGQDERVLPVWLAPIANYPRSKYEVEKGIGASTPGDIEHIFKSALDMPSLSAYRDKSFGLNEIAQLVEILLSEAEQSVEQVINTWKEHSSIVSKTEAPGIEAGTLVASKREEDGYSVLRRYLGPVQKCRVPTLPANCQDLFLDIREALKKWTLNRSANAALLAPQTVLLLQAPGGSGKAGILTQLARNTDVIESFPDGILWRRVGCDANEEVIDQIIIDILDDLGFEPDRYATHEETLARFHKALSLRKALLILVDLSTDQQYKIFGLDTTIEGTTSKIIFTAPSNVGTDDHRTAISFEPPGNISEQEANDFLTRYASPGTTIDTHAMKQLASSYGYNLLAMRLLAKCVRPGIAWSDLGLAQSTASETTQANHLVYAAVDKACESLDRLGQVSKSATYLKRLAVFFHHSSFTIEDAALAFGLEEARTNVLIQLLHGYSLVVMSSDTEEQRFALHSVVKTYTVARNEKRTRVKAFVEAALRFLDSGKHTRYLLDHLLSHAVELGLHAKAVKARLFKTFLGLANTPTLSLKETLACKAECSLNRAWEMSSNTSQRNAVVAKAAEIARQYRWYGSPNQRPHPLRLLHPSLRDHLQVLLASVVLHSWSLRFAGNHVKQNPKMAIKLMKINPRILEWVDKALLKDIDFAIKAVSQDGLALDYFDKSIRENRSVVKVALQQNGCALEYADPTLLHEEDIVLAATTADGFALDYASEELRRKPELLRVAVAQNGHVLQYADQALRKDPEFVLKAVKSTRWAFQFVAPELLEDCHFMRLAVKQDGQALRFASAPLRADRDLVLTAIKQDGRAIDYAAQELKDDKKMALIAVRQNGLALAYLNKSLQNDSTIASRAIKQNKLAKEYTKFESSCCVIS